MLMLCRKELVGNASPSDEAQRQYRSILQRAMWTWLVVAQERTSENSMRLATMVIRRSTELPTRRVSMEWEGATKHGEYDALYLIGITEVLVIGILGLEMLLACSDVMDDEIWLLRSFGFPMWVQIDRLDEAFNR
jgi:hypothetical protein